MTQHARILAETLRTVEAELEAVRGAAVRLADAVELWDGATTCCDDSPRRFAAIDALHALRRVSEGTDG